MDAIPPAWVLSSLPGPGELTKGHGPLSCKPVYRHPYSTKYKSVTHPASAVKNIVSKGENPLRKVWISKYMIDRLICYVDLVAKIEKQDELINPPAVYATDCPGTPLPLPSTIFDTISELKALEEYIRVRSPAPIVNIFPAQDEVKSQILELINVYLKMRYSNRAAEGGALFEQGDGNPVPLQTVEEHIHFPSWTRISADHLSDVLGHKSGYPDWGLSSYPTNAQDKAFKVTLVEVKTFQTYTTDDLKIIYDGSEPMFDNGLFDGLAQDAAELHGSLLLCQLWGELLFFDCDIGFTTNLDEVIVFVRVVRDRVPQGQSQVPAQDTRHLRSRDQTSASGAVSDKKKVRIDEPGTSSNSPEPYGPVPKGFNNTGLILSEPIKWTDPRLHKIIIELSFLAVDQALWKGANPSRSIRDILCPIHECRDVTVPAGAV